MQESGETPEEEQGAAAISIVQRGNLKALEKTNGDAQDIEFTVQKGELFLLQTRTAKRAPEAAVRMAVDMVGEGMISEDVALERVSPDQVRVMLLPSLAPGAADGLPLQGKYFLQAGFQNAKIKKRRFRDAFRC